MIRIFCVFISCKFCSYNSRHSVEKFCELALFMSSAVLVNNISCSCLVYSLNCYGICGFGFILVSGFNCSIKLLNSSFQVALEHLILKSLSRNDFNALLSRFNVWHFVILSAKIGILPSGLVSA